MPFLIPWTDDLDSPSFAEGFVRYHLEARSGWTPDDWRLELGVWRHGSLIGSQGIEAKNFRRERTTTSASWLALTYQRHGYGTEMRAAILELAFSGLGAIAAGSGAITGNVASARVSEKLGYSDAGEREHLRDGEPVRERRFLIRREHVRRARRTSTDHSRTSSHLTASESQASFPNAGRGRPLPYLDERVDRPSRDKNGCRKTTGLNWSPCPSSYPVRLPLPCGPRACVLTSNRSRSACARAGSFSNRGSTRWIRQ